MIMTKYRQQVSVCVRVCVCVCVCVTLRPLPPQVGQFISAGTQEKALASDTTADVSLSLLPLACHGGSVCCVQELLHRTDQLYHMAAIIALTMQEEDSASQKTLEYVTQLECENKHLRELLHFTQSGVLESATDHTPLDTATPVNSPSTASSFPQSSPSHPHRPLPHFPPATDPHSEGAGGASDPHSGGAGGGYVHTATPLNSGQSTPVVVGGGGEGNTQPLLEQAIDKLNDDSRDVM